MSEVLLAFIEPYEKFAETDEAMENLIMMGITAWNVALLPEEERDREITNLSLMAASRGSLFRRLISKLQKAIFGESQNVALFRQIACEMVERKLRYYGGIRRFIVNYELSQTEDQIHLFVVSTLTPVE